jgi:spore coat protein SA
MRNLVEIIDVKIRQWAIRKTDLTLSVSDAMGRIYQSAGVVTDRTTTVYNPPTEEDRKHDPEDIRRRYGIPRDALMVLYAGKFSFGKGTDVLLEIVPDVGRAVPRALFVLAGRKSPLIPIPSNESVVATGPLRHEEVVGLYSIADVVAVPSVWKEPFPRVILEAMSAGLPVVATRTGGIPELVEDGVTGILVPPRDGRRLAEALIQLLEEPETRRTMGESGQRKLERFFTRERIRDDLVKAYRACLRRLSREVSP